MTFANCFVHKNPYVCCTYASMQKVNVFDGLDLDLPFLTSNLSLPKNGRRNIELQQPRPCSLIRPPESAGGGVEELFCTTPFLNGLLLLFLISLRFRASLESSLD